MSDTRSEIVCIANELIKTIGYNAFSYADISKQLSIKNAAIHYYFPVKSDLGIAVIRRNAEIFKERIRLWAVLDERQQYISYITMHDSFVRQHWTCIVGSLASAYDTLPENMQKELQNLVNSILDWLTALLEKGQKNKLFHFKGSAKSQANVIYSALLSSLQMNKVLRNDIYSSIQEKLLSI